MPHKFDPEHLERLTDPERLEWQDPPAILRAMGLRSGMTLADVGCGTGFFSLPAGDLVGPAGRVYAVDMQEAMLWALQGRIVKHGATRVLPVLSREDVIPLPSGSVDRALLVNALHELDGDATLQEVRRILRGDGRFGVVDWKKEPMEHGPPVEHRIAVEEARAWLAEAGFEGEDVEVGPYHYGLLLSKVEKG
ncbi:MAG: methyltransferase domain-containing protein [Thermoplasmata archaeon]|nr:methyltransferase domain-containing protein [Thermoplasmata archaeon]